VDSDKDQLLTLLQTVRFTGTVTRMFPDFAFINLEMTDIYVFLHRNSLGNDVDFDDLREGDRVSFRVKESRLHKGKLTALKVRRADENTDVILSHRDPVEVEFTEGGR
jgi:cold shock CspA family protein